MSRSPGAHGASRVPHGEGTALLFWGHSDADSAICFVSRVPDYASLGVVVLARQDRARAAEEGGKAPRCFCIFLSCEFIFLLLALRRKKDKEQLRGPKPT